MINALRNPRYFNLIYQALLVLVIVQQLYFPQPYKYVHLALVFARMLLSEVYDIPYRYQKLEPYFVLAIVITVITSILQNMFSLPIGFIYLLSLAAAVILMSVFLKNMIDDSNNHAAMKKFHTKHIEMLKKGKKFTNGIFYMLIGVNAMILVYIVYEFIKLFS
ncbi:MAG: hypothetical protein LCH34_09070 [Firmicutes bacterium]|nr:hypothetical protein [Bacillota bacterium]